MKTNPLGVTSHSPMNLFFNHGNREALEQVKGLRLAKIASVNVDDMVAEIEFLEESTGKTRVPLPMPTAYPGGGIFSVPKKGAMVIVGIRSMQVPIILGYYPFNAFTPDSYFAISRQVFGIPDELSEGDVFMRAASPFAKCAACGVTSALEGFEANLDPNSLIERCPNCSAPAFVNDENGQIAKLNKLLLGMTLHMRADGKLFIQGDNQASRENGDTERLIKIVIDGVTGNMTIADAGDLNVTAQGSVFLGCKKMTVKSDGPIEEVADSRVANIGNDSVENVMNKTIQAANTVLATAQTLSLKALGIMNLGADTRATTVTGDDVLSAGSLIASIDADREVQVGANDIEEIILSKTVTIGTTLGVTVKGGSTMDVGIDHKVTVTGALTEKCGSYSMTVTGASSTSVTGAYSVAATGAVTIASSGSTASLAGTSVILNGGTLGVARLTDTALSSTASDPAFWLFVNNLIAFLTVFSADSAPFTSSKSAAAVAAASAPVSITSAINSASATVKAGS